MIGTHNPPKTFRHICETAGIDLSLNTSGSDCKSPNSVSNGNVGVGEDRASRGDNITVRKRRAPKQRLQIQQCAAADRRHFRHAHTAAGRIKHPLLDLQEPTSRVLIDAAPTHSSPIPDRSFVDRHSASVPRVPRVTDFSQFNIMGVALSTHITRSATTRAKRI